MLDINGFIVDIRNAPKEIQQRALANDLIPYLPHDKS